MWFLFVSYFEKMERKKETEGNRKGKDDTGMRKPETEGRRECEGSIMSEEENT